MRGTAVASWLGRVAAAGAAALMVLTVVAGCGGAGTSTAASSTGKTSTTDLAALAKQAKAEGTLTLYGSPEADKINTWVKPFASKYGVKVNYYRAVTSDLFKRFTLEETSGQYQADLISMSLPDDFTIAQKKGWLAKYVPQSRSKLDNAWVTDNTVYPLYITTQAIMWNSTLVSPADQADIRKNGLKALLEPKWKGKIAITSAEAGGGQLGGYYQIVQNKSLGWSYLQQLKDQNPVVYTSSITMASDIAAGSFALGLGGSDTGAWPLMQKGAPVGFSYYKDTVSAGQSVALAAHAPHPAAAKLFLEWATTLQAQESLADIAGGLIARTDWKIDNRGVAKSPGYVKPTKLNVGWASDPNLTDNETSIVNRWVSIFGKAK